MLINLQAAWVGFLLGCVSGAATGLFFHDPNWLGGYASWERRMIRLGHISFFGIGLLNLFFALTARSLGMESGLETISRLLILAAATMPLVCYLSAWKKPFRHLFFIPALSATAGIAWFAWKVMAA
jgi:hypothetical protein